MTLHVFPDAMEMTDPAFTEQIYVHDWHIHNILEGQYFEHHITKIFGWLGAEAVTRSLKAVTSPATLCSAVTEELLQYILNGNLFIVKRPYSVESGLSIKSQTFVVRLRLHMLRWRLSTTC